MRFPVHPLNLEEVMLNKCSSSASVLWCDAFGSLQGSRVSLSNSALTLAPPYTVAGVRGYQMLHMLLAPRCGPNVLGVRWMLRWTLKVDIWLMHGPFKVQAQFNQLYAMYLRRWIHLWWAPLFAVTISKLLAYWNQIMALQHLYMKRLCI